MGDDSVPGRSGPVAAATRSQWVDVAKGIGIVLVVYGHVTRGLVNARLMENSELFRTIDSIVYSFHMPLFFFLSGLFFCESLAKRGHGFLILNKVDTIVYPYIVWSLIQGFIEIALSRYTNANIGLADVVTLFWNPRAQFWFLYALFLIFVVFSVIVVRRTRWILASVFLLSAALFVAHSHVALGNALDLVVANAVFFAAGIVFERFGGNAVARRKPVFAALGVAFVAFQLYFHAVLHKTYLDIGWLSLLLALVSILFVASLALRLERFGPRALIALGTASMAIYLMHILFSSGARILTSKVLHYDATSVHLVIGMFGGLVLPMIAFNLMRPTPLHGLFTMPKRLSIEALFVRMKRRLEKRSAVEAARIERGAP